MFIYFNIISVQLTSVLDCVVNLEKRYPRSGARALTNLEMKSELRMIVYGLIHNYI
jgi:hypothetical protein